MNESISLEIRLTGPYHISQDVVMVASEIHTLCVRVRLPLLQPHEVLTSFRLHKNLEMNIKKIKIIQNFS